MKKILFFILFLIAYEDLYACCGCSLVFAHTTRLRAIGDTEVKITDKQSGAEWDKKVLSQNRRYLPKLKETKNDIRKEIKLNKGMVDEYEKLRFLVHQKESIETRR